MMLEKGRVFKLQSDSRSVSLSLKKLLVQRKATGSIAPLPRPGYPPAFSGTLLERLDEFVRQHPDATLAEIREHFASEVCCSLVTVHQTLKRLGFRRKKNSPRQRTGAFRREKTPSGVGR